VSDTTVTVTVGGSPLSAADRQSVRSVDIAEAMGAQTQVSVVVDVTVDDRSNWTSPLDALVAPFATFEVTLRRGEDTLVVPARATGLSWALQAGGSSTFTVAGLDASADLDRVERDRPWGDHSDAQIAQELLGPTARVGTTPTPDGSDAFTPHQRGTDWSFLRTLAARNDFDVYYTVENGTVVPVFDRVDPNAPPQTSLDLGYGALGGAASVQVQLVAGQRVEITYLPPGGDTPEVAADDGTGNAMGTQSLGGAVTVLRDQNDVSGKQPPDRSARVLAERSAFGADLSVTLNTPEMPLVRARRTVRVRGLGTLVSGLWLVKSVRHTVTQAGHTQALTLTRNALGDDAAAGAGGLLGAAAALAGAL